MSASGQRRAFSDVAGLGAIGSALRLQRRGCGFESRRLHVVSPRLPRYISLSDAAQVLAVSEKTIRRFIASGELPGYTLGKRGPGSGRPIRMRLEDVEALLRRIPTAGDDRPGQRPP